MAKAKAFEFDESLLDEEENRQNEESIETIMAKAKAFELDESFLIFYNIPCRKTVLGRFLIK